MMYSFAALGLVIYLVIVMALGSFLGLTGNSLLIFRAGMAVIGVLLALACVFLFTRKKKASAPGAASSGPGGAADDLELILREAEAKVASSQLGAGAKYSSLPVVFVIGPQGTAKTTSMVYSGLEPELLAGQVYRDNSIIPTELINLWFAGRAIFLEAGTMLLGNDSAWSRVIRKMQPGRLHSIFSSGGQSPRAAVVCLDCEAFFTPGASEQSAAAARHFRGRLGEISRVLGISVPVYVLFTKLDKIPFFQDYVQNLKPEEVSQVVGVTLPLGSNATSGVYSEQTTQRLNDAMDRLFLGLCDKRREFLSRENDSTKLPGVYEFPREWRKLRTSVVQFLVDLCRPSQLTVGPFLRGFYFSGVRPVTVNEVAPAPVAPRQQQTFDPASGATRMFRMGEFTPEQVGAPARQSMVGRRVPQWVFLDHILHDVVLADHAALGASASSTKTSVLRKVLLSTAAALCLVLSIIFAISYFSNRGLERTVLDAAKGISAADSAGANVPSLDALTRLETLRQSLETLADYDRNGAPWHFRWGLYAGSGFYQEVRQIYFDRFRRLLFASTQDRMLTTLSSLPAVPGPNDNPGYAYDTLKAYLMTTSHHEKTDQAFLPPALDTRWQAGRNIDAERKQLVRKQFDFYSRELFIENPYSSNTDAETVTHARRYLLQASSAQPIYRTMLAEANRRFPTINFNKKFPGTSEVVVNNRDVTGAFSKEGWAFMQDAIANPDRYFKGEEWVLGQQDTSKIDRAKLTADLKALYYPDFLNQWRDYMRKGAVVKYDNLSDAVKKLTRNASAQSPLLAMFCLASQNTGVDDPDTLKSFKPLHSVVPPACAEQYIGKDNADYMRSLSDLELSVEDVVKQPPGESDKAADQSHDKARTALSITRQMALTFGSDPNGDLHDSVRKLIEAPITYADALLGRLGPQELNAKGKGLCTDIHPLFTKYPFNPKSQVNATLEDVNTVFRPQQGILWVFYDQNLKKLLPKRGSEYAPDPANSMNITRGFVIFFNNMAAFSSAIYASGPEPKLAFAMRPILTADIESAKFSLNGQAVDYAGQNNASKQFAWPGDASGVKLVLKEGGTDYPYSTWSGLWGVFNFFQEADSSTETSAGGIYEWHLRSGTIGRAVTGSKGQPIISKFEVDMGSAPHVFRKGFFSQMGCVPEIAK